MVKIKDLSDIELSLLMTHIQTINRFDEINWSIIKLVTNETDYRFLLGDLYTIVSYECKRRFLKQTLKNEN